MDKAAKIDEESALRKKSSRLKKQRGRNVYDDVDMKAYLCLTGDDPRVPHTAQDVVVKSSLNVGNVQLQQPPNSSKIATREPKSLLSRDISVKMLSDLKLDQISNGSSFDLSSSSSLLSSSQAPMARQNSDLLEWKKNADEFHHRHRDLWDELIDTVQDISEARVPGSMSKLIQDLVFNPKTITLQQELISGFNPSASISLPTPSPRANKPLIKSIPGTPAAGR